MDENTAVWLVAIGLGVGVIAFVVVTCWILSYSY